MTQPPALLLKLLLQSDCTAKVPVASVMFAEAPCPREIQAHLSPFSRPLPSSQPLLGNGSLTDSPYSWPPTMLTPSSNPALPLLTKFCPQEAPASVMYGRLV